MQVYLTVTPKPTSLPTLTPTPVPTEKPSLTPLPESTEVPSATPVVREKNTSKHGSNGVAGTKPTTRKKKIKPMKRKTKSPRIS